MNQQQKLSVNVEKQESGYGLRLQLNSMPLDFIVQIIDTIESRLTTGLPTPFPNDAGKVMFASTQSATLLPQGKIINGEYYGNAYCVKCKIARQFIGEILTSDSGRRMAKGKCGICGTRLNRLLGKGL